MNDTHINTIAQLTIFLKGSQYMCFKAQSRVEKYKWITKVLLRFKYFKLKRKDKRVVKNYIKIMTGYSRSQITRLITRQKKKGEIIVRNNFKRNRFNKVYSSEDILLLAKTDKVHNRLSGPATKKIFEREYKIFNKKEFKNLSQISSSHIYNLRKKILTKKKQNFIQKQNRHKLQLAKDVSQSQMENLGFYV